MGVAGLFFRDAKLIETLQAPSSFWGFLWSAEKARQPFLACIGGSRYHLGGRTKASILQRPGRGAISGGPFHRAAATSWASQPGASGADCMGESAEGKICAGWTK